MVANKDESVVNILEPNPAHETKQETDLCDSVTVQTAGEETGTGSLHGRVGIGIIHVDINAGGVGYNGLRSAGKSIGSDLAPIDRVVHGGLPDGDKGLGYVSVFPKCVAVSDDVILEENGAVLKEEFMFPVVVGSSCVKNADVFDPVSIGGLVHFCGSIDEELASKGDEFPEVFSRKVPPVRSKRVEIKTSL
ncbi:hypothetical protein PI124_g11798 [Phytophthora idaei]|nr:hypothetical protein PI124_g11798 [Phytophthora idaei]